MTLTSSVELDGRQAACPGEVVTFTCTVAEAVALEWIAEPFIPRNDPIRVQFLPDAKNGTMMDLTDQIYIVLDAVSPTTDPRFVNFISFLTVNDSSAIRGIIIQCIAGDPDLTANNTLTTGSKLYLYICMYRSS